MSAICGSVHGAVLPWLQAIPAPHDSQHSRHQSQVSIASQISALDVALAEPIFRTPEQHRAFADGVESLRRTRSSSDGDQSLTWVFGSQNGATIMARLTDGIADGTSSLQLPRSFAKRIDAKFPVQSWRQPTRSTCALATQFQSTAPDLRARTVCKSQARFDLHRYELDVWRDRLEDFVSQNSFTKNANGLFERSDYPVLYRVDYCSPSDILDAGGFIPSSDQQGIEPMIETSFLVTSCSLKASGVVLQTTGRANIHPQFRYQYAIQSEGISAASWLENFSYLQDELPEVLGDRFDIGFDEVHVDVSAISIDRIFVIGSDDPFVMKHLVDTYAAAGALSVFGVSVKEFCARYGAVESDLDKIPRIPVLDQPQPSTNGSKRLIGSSTSTDGSSFDDKNVLSRLCNWLCA